MMDLSRVHRLAQQLYGLQAAPAFVERLQAIILQYETVHDSREARVFTQRDAVLITYPDMVREKGKAPLSSLASLGEKWLAELVSGIHILPFFPSSSDDGFSVMDYRSVDSAYGTWGDIRQLASKFELMFDAVINHASARGMWFRAFLRGEQPYDRFFVTVNGDPDLSAVVRPRTSPLITEFQSRGHTRRVWTTFSADQADLDFHNPLVLLEVLDILLFYVQQGAMCLRLDAIAYAWKDLGTTCIHRPEVHAMVQLIRALMDVAAPHVRLVTETNVAHHENMRYLGGGADEAHLIYNFTLPPLLLHAFLTAQAETLAEWASSIQWPPRGTSFFNVLATHDGIGLNGLRGIVAEPEIERMAEIVGSGAGRVSRRSNADGTTSPYEINANYFDALDETGPETDQDLQISRFLTAHAIMLSIKGVPGIYFHSLFGSRGWRAGIEATGHARSVNRERLELRGLEDELAHPGSVRAKIFAGMRRLLRARRSQPALSPDSPQEILPGSGGIFAYWRGQGEETVLCVHNITGSQQELPALSLSRWGRMENLLYPEAGGPGRGGSIFLEPFESMWLRMKG